MDKCPNCDSSGCGSVIRVVKTAKSSDGFENAEGVFIQHRTDWVETATVVEQESLTCLRRQLADAKSELAKYTGPLTDLDRAELYGSVDFCAALDADDINGIDRAIREVRGK
jgi:hypothetical protein